ncbi:cytochrome p450 [Moniliophthora roreri]|nr:cytochrome p450 [Moniliophthora roreri]
MDIASLLFGLEIFKPQAVACEDPTRKLATFGNRLSIVRRIKATRLPLKEKLRCPFDPLLRKQEWTIETISSRLPVNLCTSPRLTTKNASLKTIEDAREPPWNCLLRDHDGGTRHDERRFSQSAGYPKLESFLNGGKSHRVLAAALEDTVFKLVFEHGTWLLERSVAVLFFAGKQLEKTEQRVEASRRF